MDKKRNLEDDLNRLLNDYYVWNYIAEKSEKSRLRLINKLAMLAGDLVCGGPWKLADGSISGKMFENTTDLAEASSYLIGKIEEAEDETV